MIRFFLVGIAQSSPRLVKSRDREYLVFEVADDYRPEDILALRVYSNFVKDQVKDVKPGDRIIAFGRMRPTSSGVLLFVNECQVVPSQQTETPPLAEPQSSPTANQPSKFQEEIERFIDEVPDSLSDLEKETIGQLQQDSQQSVNEESGEPF